MPFTDFYRGRRVLVTGHTGFKGAWLALWLRELGADVTGFALAPDTTPSLFELADVASRCRHVEGDLRNRSALAEVFEQAQPEIVFHLAAQPLVRRSYQQPVDTFETNVLGTVNVLEEIRRGFSVSVAVLITTDKVYENREWLYGYREGDPLGGYDPYSASKAAAELVISSYRQAFFQDPGSEQQPQIASVRAGNVIGGGDWAEDRIIPDAIRAAQSHEPLLVRSPHSIRPWQHVLEPLAGYLALGQRLGEFGEQYSGAWNLGPAVHDSVPVGELVDRFLRNLGHGSWKDVSEKLTSAPHEAGLLRLCCDQAWSRFGWRPVYDTEKALEITARWYRECGWGTGEAATLCLEDIFEYLDAARELDQWWAA